MHFQFYSTEDFIQDEFFQQWVFSPGQESDDFWESFLLTYPLQKKNVEEAKAFLLAIKFESTVPETVVSRIKTNFNAAIDALEEDRAQLRITGSPAKKSLFGGAFRKVYPVAASLILVCLFTAYFLIPEDTSLTGLGTLALQAAKTPKGKQHHIVLQDGTNVWLNANSELKYPKTFSGNDTREVYLTGEAFFDVSENKVKPFIVHASGLDIKVLGTAFNIKSYSEDSVVETTLVRGKVSIASSEEDRIPQITLLPNQQALFRKDSRKMVLENAINTENYVGWKNGWMIFDDKPFSYIKETLERWYNVKIIMQDEKSLGCTFSARFKDKTLQEVLDIFKTTESINYWINGDQVIINGKLCQYENLN
jgi:ferric-dicitrate binding protein FerR (iron transport regulator)